jgi:hypothetical protein
VKGALQLRRSLRAAGRRFLALCLLAAWGSALAISYTVQVVAVSDQGQALTLVRQLLLDGYPAYVTRTTTAQGDIYRVRVGGFANRAAALLYAEAMPEFPALAGPPLPTLAENIPPGVTPFEPRLLLEVANGPLQVIGWLPEPGVRLQGGAGQPDTYHLFAAGATVKFDAWQAWPGEGPQVLRLRDLPLWPATWRDDPPAVLSAQRDALLQFMSERFGLPLAALEDAVVQESGTPPRLMVLERFNPWGNPEAGTLLAVVVNPAAAADGAPALLEGEEAQLVEPAVLFTTSGEGQPEAETFTVDDWSLGSEEGFMLQELPGGDRAWRIAAGVPLWTDGQRVLARSGATLLLYDFVSR